MKAQGLLIAVCCVNVASFAQPVILYSNESPQGGAAYVEHMCGVSHVNQGPAGAGVTWNFGSLSTISTDTITYAACPGPVFCDSFSGSGLASLIAGKYDFYAADTNTFAISGQQSTGGNIYYSLPEAFVNYPFSYGLAARDSFAWYRPAVQWYGYGVDSLFGDGYGTLILPSGTWNNTLRVHTVSLSVDSNFFSSVATVDSYRTDIYNWYTPGIHGPLLSVYYDYAGTGGIPLLAQVIYFTKLTEGIAGAPAGEKNIAVFPNPANGHITVKMSAAGGEVVSFELYDMMGNRQRKPEDKILSPGVNEISIDLPCLPAGPYLLRIHSDEYSVVKQVEIRE